MKRILIIVVLCLLAFYGYQKFQSTEAGTSARNASMTFTAEELENIPPTYNELVTEPQSPKRSTRLSSPTQASSFTCDGRKHCSQMTSCEEATYFSQHCPDTKMDGNNDGIPCGQQWCK